MTLAIFDFDGTITTKDSFEDFIFYTHGFKKMAWGILINSPILIAYLLKIIPNWQVKEDMFAYFYKNWEVSKFEMLAQNYLNDRLPKIIRPKALEKLHWHKNQGHTVVVVSASFENYLQIWCKQQGFALLATQLNVKDGKFTGKFASRNCYGDEKVRRIREIYNLNDFKFIYAYGDSRGDIPLKNIANEFHYKPFREN